MSPPTAVVEQTSAAAANSKRNPRRGNLQRAAWRRKCRIVLANHLNSRLGIAIDPTQVRLKPDDQDGYKWSCLPEKKHLFQKQLSKLSVGIYTELCREVGKSFEAVASPDESSDLTAPDAAHEIHSDASFSSTIQFLQEENTRLRDESRYWRQLAGEADLARQRAEGGLLEVQTSLSTSQTEYGSLTIINQRLQKQLYTLTRKLGHSRRQSRKVMRALENWDSVTEWSSDRKVKNKYCHKIKSLIC